MAREEKIDFSEFNNAVDMEQLSRELTDLKDGKQSFEDVPDDSYAVSIDKMSIAKSRNDSSKLIFKVQFTIVEGEYKNRKIFWNQNVMTARGIHAVCEFIRSLEVFDEDTALWNNDFEDFSNLILDASQACDEDRMRFVIEYSHNDRGFASVTVDKVL